MRRAWKRYLSLLLAMVMLAGLPVHATQSADSNEINFNIEEVEHPLDAAEMETIFEEMQMFVPDQPEDTAESAECEAELIQDGELPERSSKEITSFIEDEISEESISGNELVRAGRSLTLDEYMYMAMKRREIYIDISAYGVMFYSKDTVRDIFSEVINRHPDLYFVTGTFRYYYLGNRLMGFEVYYAWEGAYDDNAFRTEVAKTLTLVQDNMSDVEKALIIHDAIVGDCEYDISLEKQDIYSAYGVIVNKEAVCHGYALAFLYYMQQLEIDCSLVTSNAMNHAWNLLRISGKYYHIDATWDDPVWVGDKDIVGRVYHEYFLLSDWEMRARDHYSWSAYHRAEDTYYDYFFWNQVYTPFLNDGKKWYYIEEEGSGQRQKALYKSGDVKVRSGNGTVIKEFTQKQKCKTPNESYLDFFIGLSTDGENVYFNTPEAIYSMKFDGSQEKILFDVLDEQLTIPNDYFEIYGLKYQNGFLNYLVTDSLDQKRLTVWQDRVLQLDSLPISIPVTNISLNKSQVSLKAGQTERLKTTISPGNATNKAIIYTSSNEQVAMVSARGLIRAVGGGSAKITARSLDGHYIATCMVNATVPVDGISLNKKSHSMNIGQTYKLTSKISPSDASNKAVTWSSSNKKVATVSNGRVKALTKGKAVIKAVTADGKYAAKCTVNVSVKAPKTPKVSSKERKQVLVTWKKLSGVSGYQVAYSTKKNKGYKVKTIKGASKQKYTLKGLKSQGTYYIKIRAYNNKKVNRKTKKDYSSYTKPKKIKVK